jgi:hypothetical protein
MRAVLIVNPSNDAAFARHANELLDEGADTPARLQRRLRAQYPRAVVRARELSSEPNVVWYVYRDGTWTPSSGADDR